MIQFRPGSQVWQLVELLSLAGELPFYGLTLPGSEQTLQPLIVKRSVRQAIRDFDTGEEISCRLLTGVKGNPNPSNCIERRFRP